MSDRESTLGRLDRNSIVMLLLACLGAVNAGYLTWVKFTGRLDSCSGIGDCEAVNSSRYAEIGGVPVALFGLAGFLFVALLIWSIPRVQQWAWELKLVLFGVTLAGTVYSAYLTYVELFILHAVCPFCVVSAVLMVILFIMSVQTLRRAFEGELQEV